MLHLLATLLLSLLLGWATITNYNNNNHIDTYATTDNRAANSPSIKSTSNDIITKILVDSAIQALQDGDRNKSIKFLLAADQEFVNASESRNSTYGVDPRYIVEYLVQLMQNESGPGITKDKALVYLNLVDSQLADQLNEPNSNSTLATHYLLPYENQRYGIRVLYPYYWSIDGTSYHTGKIGTQIVSFFLPSAGIDLPIISIGIDNLSQSLTHRPVSISDYLNLSLSHKNSTGFPGFKLLEGNMSNQDSTINNINNKSKPFGQSNMYTIVWSYTHPTYGLRKSIEFGTVTGGSKGFFIDYTSSATKFLKYLPVTRKMLASFENNFILKH
jgi:hypothetical protein